MTDVIIIGAGVSGCASARELARYKADILVLEKEEDVCCGTSKANSAIVHAGFDAAHGTLMARLNVEGSKRMPALARELDFAYDPCGSLVVCLQEEDLPKLQQLYENGTANGVEGLRIIRRDELKADGCLFELYCITKELEAADRAYEVITELSEILTRRGITRTLFDKSQVAKPSAYYSGVFREVLERGRTT